MAKKQTRRSISISRELFDQVKAIAEGHGFSLSKMTESALKTYCSMNGDILKPEKLVASRRYSKSTPPVLGVHLVAGGGSERSGSKVGHGG